MAKICLACTAAALVPSSLHLLIKPKKKQFLYALVNSSLAFFLFSFQVHEKSILIAAIPAVLLFPMDAFMVFWFLQVSTFSMFPLLVRDGLLSAFIGLSVFYFVLVKVIIDFTFESYRRNQQSRNFLRILWNINRKGDGKFGETLMPICFVLSTALAVLLAIAFLFVPPPATLPFIHPLLISAYSCSHFVMFFVYFNVRQIFYE